MKETLEEVSEVNYPIDIWTEEQALVRRLAFSKGAKWQQEHGQEVRHSVQVDVIDLIQFLSMDQEFNGYGSVSKETAKYFLEKYKKQ